MVAMLLFRINIPYGIKSQNIWGSASTAETLRPRVKIYKKLMFETSQQQRSMVRGQSFETSFQGTSGKTDIA